MTYRPFVVWVQYDADGPWHAIERPARYGKQLPLLNEQQAVREAAECRAHGIRAMALPEGANPNAKAVAS